MAWCFGKHDRPWAERAVFGEVRRMDAAGLRRKSDADAYVRKIDALAVRDGPAGGWRADSKGDNLMTTPPKADIGARA